MIFIKDKRGIELAISTIILLVLGILVLIGFVLVMTGSWDDFKAYVKSITGSETSRAIKLCGVQCDLDNKYDFCCGEKKVDGNVMNCSDDLLRGDCEINCEGMCGGENE